MPEQLRESADVGANLAGYFTAELGVGELGRLVVDAARAAGLPTVTVENDGTQSRREADFVPGDDAVRYPVTIAGVTQDEFVAWDRATDGALTRERYVIGVWAWELDAFPVIPEALRLVDEIWAISDFSRRAIQAVVDVPVHEFPMPIREARPAPELDRGPLGIPDGPYWLFAFDFFSVLKRKNPLGLLEAYRKAFPGGDGPTLVIKAINSTKRPRQRERLLEAISATPGAHLVEAYLPADQLLALTHGASLYTSLHRAEGYGLTMAESMAAGVPVLATGYSGNLGFMDDSCALLVPWARTEIGPGAAPYPATGHWAEPDLEAASRLMRWAFEHPEELRAIGQAGRARAAQHSMDKAAAFVAQRVTAGHALETVRRGVLLGTASDVVTGEVADALQQHARLRLRDHLVALEAEVSRRRAQVARLEERVRRAEDETASVRRELAEVIGSKAHRVGRAVAAPARWARRKDG